MHSIYVGNILDVFALSHFVFSCHLPLHIYLLRCGWEVFCIMSLIWESALSGAEADTRYREKNQRGIRVPQPEAQRRTFPSLYSATGGLYKPSLTHFSYSLQHVIEIPLLLTLLSVT